MDIKSYYVKGDRIAVFLYPDEWPDRTVPDKKHAKRMIIYGYIFIIICLPCLISFCYLILRYGFPPQKVWGSVMGFVFMFLSGLIFGSILIHSNRKLLKQISMMEKGKIDAGAIVGKSELNGTTEIPDLGLSALKGGDLPSIKEGERTLTASAAIRNRSMSKVLLKKVQGYIWIIRISWKTQKTEKLKNVMN